MARAARRRVSGGVFALGLVLGLGLGAAVAAPQGSADVQWAQQQLKDKGFDPGHPNGEMTARTKAALTAFQRSVGLPASGELNQATIDRLMTGRPASPTVGNLAAPQHNHGAAPAGHELAPSPHAAPAGRVESGGVGDQPVMAIGAAPRAAPSGAVTTLMPAAPGVPGSPGAGPGSAPPGETEGGPPVLMAPEWVRSLVVGVIAAIFFGFTALWWWSGRRRPRPGGGALVGAGRDERLEPSFGAGERGHGDSGLRGERLR